MVDHNIRGTWDHSDRQAGTFVMRTGDPMGTGLHVPYYSKWFEYIYGFIKSEDAELYTKRWTSGITF